MSSRGLTALLTDPGWRAEPQQVARALREAGFHCRLHTSLYVTPESTVVRFLDFLPAAVSDRLRRFLLRRHRPDHDVGAVVSWIVPELLRRLASRLGAPPDLVNLVGNASFDRWLGLVARRRVDVVVCMSGSALATMRRQRRRGSATVLVVNTPHVAEEHRIVAEEEKRLGLRSSRLRWWAAARLARRIEDELEEADLVLANSAFTRSDLVRNGLSSEKVSVASLGVDLHRFSPAPSDAGPHSPARILYVGSLTPRKGLVHLASAVRSLRRRRACELHAYGSGDARYIERLGEFVTDGTLHLHSFVPNAELADLYRSADVFVLPTLSDGFGLVVYEAMACGVPVVTTDRCGAELENGRNGVIVPYGDDNALAAALERVIADLAFAQALGRAALETAGAASWDRYRAHVAAQICALVEEPRTRVLGSRSAHSTR